MRLGFGKPSGTPSEPSGLLVPFLEGRVAKGAGGGPIVDAIGGTADYARCRVLKNVQRS